MAERIRSTWQSPTKVSSSSVDNNNNNTNISNSAPPSPLKQLQMRINATFASKDTFPAANWSVTPDGKDGDDVNSTGHTSCPVDQQAYGSLDRTSGTFHAKLVNSINEEDDDYDNEDGGTDSANDNNVDNVVSSQLCDPSEGRNEQYQRQVNGNTNNDNNNGNNVISPRRVVLYDDSNGKDFMTDNQSYLGSAVMAEVYEIGSADSNGNGSSSGQSGGPSRALMRRISSITSSTDSNHEEEIESTLDKNNFRHAEGEQVDLPADKTSTNATDLQQRVKNLVQSFESSRLIGQQKSPPEAQTPSNDQLSSMRITTGLRNQSSELKQQPPLSTQTTPAINKRPKPITIVKPMPPKTPPKTNKVRCLNHQLSMQKPSKIEQLFHEEKFLKRFFKHLEPLDRCVAAQVCRQWRKVLYSNQTYWKNLVGVIDCTHLRREHLVECILSTLQTAKLKQQRSMETSQQPDRPNNNNGVQWGAGKQHCPNGNNLPYRSTCCPSSRLFSSAGRNAFETADQVATGNRFLDNIDQEDIWRIQELCNRYTTSRITHHTSSSNNNNSQWSIGRQQATAATANTLAPSNQSDPAYDSNQDINTSGQQQQIAQTSKSTSIPSQISSTLSSVSLSSLLSPLSESSRVDSIREKLYMSLDDRGFDAICLFGATDDDIDDLISKTSTDTHQRIQAGRLNNCCITDRGLELFLMTFDQIQELVLSGCNEISNSFELKPLTNLKRLEISDCINIADGVAQKLLNIFHLLETFVIQSYHLTDAFFEYLSINTKTTAQLRHLELPNCKEITNQSLFTISKYFTKLEVLSISGSTKITDDGIEILAEQAKCLRSLNLSWCNKITNAALECIACDLSATLTDLILDR